MGGGIAVVAAATAAAAAGVIHAVTDAGDAVSPVCGAIGLSAGSVATTVAVHSVSLVDAGSSCCCEQRRCCCSPASLFRQRRQSCESSIAN